MIEYTLSPAHHLTATAGSWRQEADITYHPKTRKATIRHQGKTTRTRATSAEDAAERWLKLHGKTLDPV